MSPTESIKEYAVALGAEVLENEPMSNHTTFQIGGPARLFIVPGGTDSLASIVKRCSELGINIFTIGNGSNLLVSDDGISDVVLKLSSGFNDIIVKGETLDCGPAASLKDVCGAALDKGLTGLEFAYGIPGSCGGAVFMNAGAYGGEMKDVVLSVKYIDQNGMQNELTGRQLDFGYRHSAFTGTRNIITRVVYSLKKGNLELIRSRMDELMKRRKSKQPLEYPSAGSVFKRPEGYYAGTLIESCGLKGMRVGGAEVSKKHAGFIINAGGATCKDVLALIQKIKDEVFTQTGVTLECEIKAAGV